MLRHRITVQNRRDATAGRFGLDSTGPEWEDGDTLWASVDFVRGMRTMREGAIDVYGIVMVRCRYTDEINERSRIVYNGKTYQILGETLHIDKQDNIVQFNAQQLDVPPYVEKVQSFSIFPSGEPHVLAFNDGEFNPIIVGDVSRDKAVWVFSTSEDEGRIKIVLPAYDYGPNYPWNESGCNAGMVGDYKGWPLVGNVSTVQFPQTQYVADKDFFVGEVLACGGTDNADIICSILWRNKTIKGWYAALRSGSIEIHNYI